MRRSETDSTGPKILRQTRTTFNKFIKYEASGGIILIIATAIALIMANTPLADFYHHLVHTPVTIQIGNFIIAENIHFWINDGLMAIFFFVIGLEIKREILLGELSSFKKASLPVFAAIGGMVVPAAIFLSFNPEHPQSDGWGVPMATDIAFSLGILSLLGKRVPLAMKVFLLTFAIVDDLGAILVIALFYSDNLSWTSLFIALTVFSGLITLNLLKYRTLSVYFILGAIVWYYMYRSGIHPTIAGVMVGFTIPSSRKLQLPAFVRRLKDTIKSFSVTDSSGRMAKDNLECIIDIETDIVELRSPSQWLEHQLHGFVTFVVMPVFAFANAGVFLGGTEGQPLVGYLSVSIAVSLVVGKGLGILIFPLLAEKLGIAERSHLISKTRLLGLGLLGGIGFTMSLFIANLAYSDAQLLNDSKIGILLGSLCAGIIGFWFLKQSFKSKKCEATQAKAEENKE